MHEWPIEACQSKEGRISLGILQQDIAYLMASLCVAASGAILASILVLPTLAGAELRLTVGKTLVGIGHQLSA